MAVLFDLLQEAVLAAHDQAPEEYTYTSRNTTYTYRLDKDNETLGLGNVYVGTGGW